MASDIWPGTNSLGSWPPVRSRDAFDVRGCSRLARRRLGARSAKEYGAERRMIGDEDDRGTIGQAGDAYCTARSTMRGARLPPRWECSRAARVPTSWMRSTAEGRRWLGWPSWL